MRLDGAQERPRAVSEYLVERMALAGCTKLLFVISPGKSDILRYYGDRVEGMDVAYVVQPRAAGLCDALFRAAPFVGPAEAVAIGLPDTVWFPADALGRLPTDRLAFLLFPVGKPEVFDAVVTDATDRVMDIQVKSPFPRTNWVWGALRAPGAVFHALHRLWRERDCDDEYLGTLVNAWIANGGEAAGLRAGEAYVDVGTLHGYREALRLLTTSESGRAEVMDME
jgi:glucose-1-phosphate thymidylyltransferase